jgi:hypothetical protein
MADSKKDDATSSFNDMSEFMQKMWNPFGVPMPGFGVPGSPTGIPGAAPFAGMPGGMPFPNPAAMFATIDPAELGRKIDEMRVIETWLQMSINMMQFSIKTMELQKASLEALRSAHAPGSEKSPPGKRKP